MEQQHVGGLGQIDACTVQTGIQEQHGHLPVAELAENMGTGGAVSTQGAIRLGMDHPLDRLECGVVLGEDENALLRAAVPADQSSHMFHARGGEYPHRQRVGVGRDDDGRRHDRELLMAHGGSALRTGLALGEPGDDALHAKDVVTGCQHGRGEDVHADRAGVLLEYRSEAILDELDLPRELFDSLLPHGPSNVVGRMVVVPESGLRQRPCQSSAHQIHDAGTRGISTECPDGTRNIPGFDLRQNLVSDVPCHGVGDGRGSTTRVDMLDGCRQIRWYECWWVHHQMP